MTDEVKSLALSNGSRGLQPANFSELLTLSDMLASSGMVPKAYEGKPGAIVAAVQMGAEVGLSPMAALQNIAVINGRPSLWGDGMIAVARSHPDCEAIIETTAKDEAGVGYAECKVKRRGQPEHVVRFTVDDAKRAGLWGKSGPWTQYPKRMLQMRARSWALRDVFADALRGLQCAEEVRDYQVREDYVSPAQSVTPVSPTEPTTQRVADKVRAKSAPRAVVDAQWDDVGPPAMTDEASEAASEAIAKREPGSEG